MTANLTRVAAAATLAGVPAGLALTGGDTQTVLTVALAGWLALVVLATRRWPLAVLLLTLASVAAWRIAQLIGSGWVWPATAALVALVLAGRLRAAVITSALALLGGANWDLFVHPHDTGWVFAHLGGEALWVAAVLAAASAYRNTLRWRAEVGR